MSLMTGRNRFRRRENKASGTPEKRRLPREDAQGRKMRERRSGALAALTSMIFSASEQRKEHARRAMGAPE